MEGSQALPTVSPPLAFCLAYSMQQKLGGTWGRAWKPLFLYSMNIWGSSVSRNIPLWCHAPLSVLYEDARTKLPHDHTSLQWQRLKACQTSLIIVDIATASKAFQGCSTMHLGIASVASLMPPIRGLMCGSCVWIYLLIACSVQDGCLLSAMVSS